MALSTEIKLQDRMSGALNRITANLYSTVSAFQRVDAVSDRAFNSSAIAAASQELYSYDQRVTQLEADLVDANNRIQQMQEQTEKAANAAEGMKNIFRGVVGIISAIGVGKIIETSDALMQTTTRLNMMNDGAQTTQELFSMVYASAQDARGSLSGMADVVARFGNNAKDAFGSSAEVVAFANIIQKQMTIAGASTSEASNAMLQLSQGLGSGVLRGDELNSIFEQAPNLIQSIADYLDVPIGSIREMASEGQLTADIVKAAVFASADEVNAKFEEMPMTWAQIWQSMQNTALMKFQPVLQRINDIANSDGFQTMVDTATSAMAVLANVALNVFDTVGSIATFISDNWSIIAPLVLGVAGAFAVYKVWMMAGAAATALAAAKTAILNAVMNANPVMLIVMGVVALIGALVAFCSWLAKTTGIADSAFGIIAGAVTTLGAVIGNIFLGILELVLGVIEYLINPFINFANFLGNLFQNPISSIIYLFQGMADGVLGVLEKIASAMDFIFGSNMAGTVSGWRDGLKGMADELVAEYAPEENYEQIFDNLDLSLEDFGLERFDYGDAFNTGAAWGDGISEQLAGAFDPESLLGGETDPYSGTDDMLAGLLGDIEGNTAATADSVDISNENLKYLRDAAEQEAINQFTTAEIKLDMTNNNNIASNMDIDGIVTRLSEGLREAMESAAEGVYA
jgi:tape measure domain-containing protein